VLSLSQRTYPGLKPLFELISLRGKSSLITGAASGIGRATAIRFAEAGSHLFLVDINLDGLNSVKSEVKELFGADTEVFRADLSRKEEIDKLWSQIRGREPDVLVNNAGIYEFRDFLELDEAFLERTLSINLKSVFWMSQHMIRSRINKGGVIINVSSVEAFLPLAKRLSHYDVSKIGVIGLTRALAKEYGPRGFRINAVAPGGIKTPSVEKLTREALMKMDIETIKTGVIYRARLPLRRMGEPDEVARVILFLASDLSSYIQGAVIPVDGGFLSA
jgi:3-oxoacyl-[acyl-carrier protein] reductase